MRLRSGLKPAAVALRKTVLKFFDAVIRNYAEDIAASVKSAIKNHNIMPGKKVLPPLF